MNDLKRVLADLAYGICIFAATTALCYFTTMTLIVNTAKQGDSHEQRSR